MKLYQHQQEIIDRNPDKLGLFLGCGTGKTLTAIKLAEKKKEDTLIVCPKSLQENWRREIGKFSDFSIGFVVISKENFKKELYNLPRFRTVIIDEAHNHANPTRTIDKKTRKFVYKSQLYGATIGYIKKWEVKNLYLLTATPYMSSCWSVFALGKLIGRDWKSGDWRKAFFHEFKLGQEPPPGEKDERRRVWKQKDHIEKKIAEIVNKIGVTARLEDLFDVPDQIFKNEYFELTKEQIKAMENVVETHPIVEFTKHHQICGGTLKGDGYVEDQFFKCEKLSRTIELCRQNKKIAIICRYNNELEYIRRKIKGRQTFIINGATKNKQEIMDRIENSEECVVLINAACSEGYNMPSVPIMIFYSLDFSLKNYIQMLGRIQRANNLKKNVYIHMVTRNTIDENIYDCIMSKQDFHIEIYANNKKT